MTLILSAVGKNPACSVETAGCLQPIGKENRIALGFGSRRIFTINMHICNRCNTPWSETEQPGFNNTCEGCGMALHACVNCDHYRARAQVRCDEIGTDQILDGAASNQCDSFKFRHSLAGEAEASAEGGSSMPDDDNRPNGRDGWEKLFG